MTEYYINSSVTMVILLSHFHCFIVRINEVIISDLSSRFDFTKTLQRYSISFFIFPHV
ncbi:hypothetical protein Patl1_32337 [Pistacia atlantica]|uniref:Uncharacterized protein n=1 Tax=Pistacia atlantica TaxID=434234 RepID=A0ACC1ARA0_9ROSI|nr:hypothetical protein Patl1_32337 [Pistacia atlantica]